MTTDRRLLLAAVIAWLAVAVLGLVLGPPLGHDEAAFAVSARGDGPPWVYRSAGVTEVARIGVLLGGATWQLRIASALLGVLVVVGAYAVGTAAFSARTGAWTAAVIAGAHPMALRSSELIGDLPATGCILVGIALVTSELSRTDGPRWRLVLVGPAFALGFYLRYASALVLLIAAFAATVLWWRPMLRRPLPVLAALAVFVLLVLPHFLQSLAATGTLFGILEVSANMPRRAYAGEGLVSYLTPGNPFLYYGALVAPLLVAGLVGLVRLPPRWRPALFLGVVGLGQVLAIGLQSHAQPRYIFVAIVLMVALGIDALERLAPPRLRIASLPLVVLAWIGVVVAVPLYTRFLTDARSHLVAAATAVRTDVAGTRCLVVAKVVTQLMWYTRCAEHRYNASDLLPPWPLDRKIYVVSVPSANVAIEAALEPRPALVRELPVLDTARVWRVLPAPTVPGL